MKNINLYCSVLFTLLLLTLMNASVNGQILKVSPNGHYLVYEDGRPFFYLGDTAWELFHRLNREEADLYLENRAEKGFTVVQAVVLAERDGLNDPNPYGSTPLVNNDPATPNEKYFQHVDYIVNKADSLGLFIGMLPTWGAYWSSLNPDDVVFNSKNAFQYGKFLGERYKEKPVIWILGGDRNINKKQEREIVDALAKGLKAGDGGNHLITFHPRGPGYSSDYFHHAAWLDFNMYQSSHAAHDHDNGLYAEHDYKLLPVKPTLDGEPRYETIPAGFYFEGSDRLDRFDDYDVRQAAYWSLLSGACGHTYGNNSVWQMYAPGRESVLWAQIPWFEAINHAGAFQMGYLKRLFTSRDFEKLVPSDLLVVDGSSNGGSKVKASLAEDGSFAIIYSPRGEKFTVDKSLFKADRLKESWFDPRYGTEYTIHASGTKGIQTYTPPTTGRGNDWLLIIERED